MPPRARYFANTGKDYLGMTGKFHLDWGEIGGFKLPEALRYEAAAMMAYGARCSIGDHLHPSGRMEPETYRNIGYAYEYAEQIEPYCFNGKPAARLGLYLSGDARSDDGATNMLLEAQRDFGIVYENSFEPFDTVIFPDCAVPDEEGVKALQAFLARGGRVLFTGRSLVKEGAFQVDAGLEYVGRSAAQAGLPLCKRRAGRKRRARADAVLFRRGAGAGKGGAGAGNGAGTVF